MKHKIISGIHEYSDRKFKRFSIFQENLPKKQKYLKKINLIFCA